MNQSKIPAYLRANHSLALIIAEPYSSSELYA